MEKTKYLRSYRKIFMAMMVAFALIITSFGVRPVAVSRAAVPSDYYYEMITDMDTRMAFAAYKTLLNGPYVYGKDDEFRLEKCSVNELKSYETQGSVVSFELTNKSLKYDDLPELVTTVFEAMSFDNPMDVRSQALSMAADATIKNGIMYVGYINPPNLDFADMQKKADEAKAQIVEDIKKDKRYKDEAVVKEYLTHDYLCSHMKYDGHAAAGDGDRLYVGHTVYAAMVEGNAVCDAISMSCAAILRDLGVDCYIVDGDSHAWNMVNIDGELYELDCTWDMAQFSDDGKTDHEYFNRTTDYMTSTEHTREGLSLQLPQAEGKTYTYEKAMEAMGIAVGNRTIDGINYNLNGDMTATVKGMTGSRKSVVIPSTVSVNSHVYSVIMIEEEAFKNSAVQNVTIGDNVGMIGERAFAGCKNLKSVTIKNAEMLQYTLDDAFKGAAKKITFKIYGSKKEFKLTKRGLIGCGVRKGIFKRIG